MWLDEKRDLQIFRKRFIKFFENISEENFSKKIDNILKKFVSKAFFY